MNPNMVYHNFENFLMSKRTNSSNEVPPPKRSRRPAGFHLARPVPVSMQPSTSTSSTSLFVTVSQPDEQHGILEAQNRVLTSTQTNQDLSTSSSPMSHAQLPIEPNTELLDEPIQIQDEPLQSEKVKPKRKRDTTNAVSYILPILVLK